MKGDEIRPTMGMDYPMIDPKAFRSDKSDYERNCEKLNDSLCQVFNYNVWLDTVDKLEFETLLVIICVEFRFLHMMNCLKELYEGRKERLLNLRPDFFLGQLHKVAKRMQTLTDFVHRSHRTLRDMLVGDNCLRVEREKTVERFRKQTEWLYAITVDGEVRRLANHLFKEQELHYNPAMFITKGDSFGDHALAVMNSLVVLSLPINRKKTNDDYEVMFDKSFDDFLNSENWKNKKQDWELEIESKGDIYVQNGHGTKAEFLKGIWNRLYRHEDELLEKFGIQHVSVNTDNGKAIMSRRLFESLNRHDATDGYPQMTHADLQEYFLCLAQRQHVADEIDKLPPPPVEESQTNEMPPSPKEQPEKEKNHAPTKKSYMLHEADERKLPSVMRDANRQHLEGQHHAVIDGVGRKDYHVALCLMFYLRASNNAMPAIFSGLTRAYYNSFDKKEFTTMCTYEQFHKTLNKLNELDFKKVIACKNVDEVRDKKIGHGSLHKWYVFYHRLLPIFKLHLPERDPAQEKNGFIKLT